MNLKFGLMSFVVTGSLMLGGSLHAGIVSQHAFTGTPGNTVAPGSVADTSGNGNTGLATAPGFGSGGVYTAGIPTTNVQNSTGTVSLDITNAGLTTGTGAFSGEALTGLAAGDIDTFGGVTVEVWVKDLSNGAGDGHIAVIGGMFGVAIQSGGNIVALYGDNSSNIEMPTTAAAFSTSSWTHIAAVYTDDAGTTTGVNGGAGSNLAFSKVELFVNGASADVDADGHVFGFGFLERALGIGGHGVFGAGDNADGLIYEPVISAGALAPGSFVTFVPEPASMALFGLGGLLMLRRRRMA